MKAFIRLIDPLTWEVVQSGVNPTPSPTTTLAASNTGDTNENWTPATTISPTKLAKREALDAKAFYSLYCALSLAEYNHISSYETTKEYGIDFKSPSKELTESRKQKQISSLANTNPSRWNQMNQSITFWPKKIQSLTCSTNSLTLSMDLFIKADQSHLERKWTSFFKLRESQGIMRLAVDELIGTLMSYEAECINDDNDFKGKKSIALKSNIHDSGDTDFEEDEDDDDKKLALMVKKFKRMAKKERNFKGIKQYKQPKSKKSFTEKAEENYWICFESIKRNHI